MIYFHHFTFFLTEQLHIIHSCCVPVTFSVFYTEAAKIMAPCCALAPTQELQRTEWRCLQGGWQHSSCPGGGVRVVFVWISSGIQAQWQENPHFDADYVTKGASLMGLCRAPCCFCRTVFAEQEVIFGWAKRPNETLFVVFSLIVEIRHITSHEVTKHLVCKASVKYPTESQFPEVKSHTSSLTCSQALIFASFLVLVDKELIRILSCKFDCISVIMTHVNLTSAVVSLKFRLLHFDTSINQKELSCVLDFYSFRP